MHPLGFSRGRHGPRPVPVSRPCARRLLEHLANGIVLGPFPGQSLPWGTARADQWTACVLRPGCTTRGGVGPAPTPPTAAGLARLVTGRGPREQASGWLGRWTGGLRRPRTVERLSPEAESHCGGADQNLSASAGGVSDVRPDAGLVSPDVRRQSRPVFRCPVGRQERGQAADAPVLGPAFGC